MTKNQINKTVKALSETKAMLKKELAYTPKNQKAEYVAELRAHIAAIEQSLSNAWLDVLAAA